MYKKVTSHFTDKVIVWVLINDDKVCQSDEWFYWVGTNSGMDYWNETLDWTNGLSYFPFLTCF